MASASTLGKDAQDVLMTLLQEMDKQADAPGKFDDGWRFLEDDFDEQMYADRPHWSSLDGSIVSLVKWMDRTLKRHNWTRLPSYHKDSLTASVPLDEQGMDDVARSLGQYVAIDSRLVLFIERHDDDECDGVLRLTFTPTTSQSTLPTNGQCGVCIGFEPVTGNPIIRFANGNVETFAMAGDPAVSSTR